MIFSMMIEIIEEHIRHQFYSDHQAIFISIKFRRMDHRSDAFGVIANTEKIEETGNYSLIIREIFRAHLRSERKHILLSNNTVERGDGLFNKFGIVISERGILIK